MKFFDSHAHYNDEKFDEDRDQIIKEILKDDIKFIISGYNLISSKKAIEISEQYKAWLVNTASEEPISVNL